MTLSITTMHNYRRVWAALRTNRYRTVGDIQALTHLTRPTVRAALWYLRGCGYATCDYGSGWIALVPPSHAL